MPIRRDPPRHAGITEVPGRVRVKAPLGRKERDALRAVFAALARAPLLQELGQLEERIGAGLEALGFPPTLGWYEIHDPEAVEPGAPGVWREALPPDDADPAGQRGGSVPTATYRHPALLRGHAGTAPWMLAQALRRLAEVRACLRGTRPLSLDGLTRASYQLGDLVRQASFKLGYEELVLDGERTKEVRRRGGEESGRERGAAHEEDRRGWRAEAAEAWARDPEAQISDVARRIWKRLKCERPADDALWVPKSGRTIENAIRDLRPGGQPPRRARSSETN